MTLTFAIVYERLPKLMLDSIRSSLLCFVDFFYALVFAFVLQEAFDGVIFNDDLNLTVSEKTSRLLLAATLFYFLAWDWILGRILTLRNPYKSYTRFFFEILISIFAYATAKTALDGRSVFLVFLALVLALGVLWARRTEKQVNHRKDLRELCMIQTIQSVVGISIVIFYGYWQFIAHRDFSWGLVGLSIIAIVGMIFVYELLVPRYGGIVAGPGVPFLSRRMLRRFRKRFLFVVDWINTSIVDKCFK